jgi:glucokinase
MNDGDCILGFDIGGTKSSVVLSTPGGDLLDRLTGPTEVVEGPNATVARLIADARQLLDRHGLAVDRIAGAGIACGGPLDRQCGVIGSVPNLPGWDGVPIVEMIEDGLGIRAALENDADCCALAELFFGAGRGKKNVVAFTWGTGIGAGIIADGKLYSGSTGLAGEIGHIAYLTNGRLCQCGKPGCIEAYSSGSSVARIIRERIESGESSLLSGMDQFDTRDVCEAARKHDELAIDVLNDAARAMGRAVSIAAQALNPEVITLGTLAVHAADLLMPELMRVVESEVWTQIRKGLTITPSPLGDRVQDLAAISAYLGKGVA